MKVRLHKMFSKVEAIRAMSRAVWKLNSSLPQPLPEYAFAAKTFCTDTAVELPMKRCRFMARPVWPRNITSRNSIVMPDR